MRGRALAGKMRQCGATALGTPHSRDEVQAIIRRYYELRRARSLHVNVDIEEGFARHRAAAKVPEKSRAASGQSS
jgi:2-methylisocitrate lyase-like PEP mutase family enzyme